ncbi:MAG: hypothetical protein VX278_19770 [Myxococcota bacterium]|nr:hypothetical protein [Myxococcota bacterium]
MSNNVEQRTAKGIGEFSGECFWKLISILPPIMDVPPPTAQKAFSHFLSKRSFQAMKSKLPNIFLQSEDNSLKSPSK